MDSSLSEEDNIQSEPMSLDDIKLGRLELTKPPNADIWDGVTQIELMYNKLSELPPSPNCPLLRVLLLQGNADLMEIPPLFFHHMPLLRTLDLSYTSITDLPISFFGLVELRVLYLRGCELFMELPPEIGQLKNLEELDLNETQITHVPTEIQELINLQNLTLSFYEYDQNIGQVIPKGLISKLTMLSYLSIDVNPDHSKWDETVRVILQEISELCFLKTLILYVPRVELLKHIPENKDLDFRLVAGHHLQRIISRVPPMVEEKFKQRNRSLRFVNGVNVPHAINMVFGRTNTFFLDRHMTIKHLSQFGLMNLEQLQVCILAECNEMQTIVEKGYSYINALSCLQVLSVFYMKNLRGIWEGGTPSSLFLGQLKSLTLHTCPNLTTVFTLDLIDNLVNLEELLVQDCPKVTTLITRNSSAFSAKSFLPKIRKVSLLYLPELVSISSGLQIGPILEKIGFYYCPKLQNVSTRELSSKRLKVIKGETKWWEALRWKEAMRGQNLNDFFSPIDEEVDIMTQLVADVDESSSSKNEEIHHEIGDWGQTNLRNEVVQELVKGREMARQLKILLSEHSPSRGTSEVLIPKITASYEKALAVLTGKVGSLAEASQPTDVALSSMAEWIPWSGISPNEATRYLKDQEHKATRKRKAMSRWTKVAKLFRSGYIRRNWAKYGREDSNPMLAEKLDAPYPEDDFDSLRIQAPKQSSSLQLMIRKEISKMMLAEKLDAPDPVDDFDSLRVQALEQPSSLQLMIRMEISKMLALEQPARLQLMFTKKLSLPIFTGTKVQDIDGNPLTIVLVDKNIDPMVPKSLPHPIKLEIVVLDGGFSFEDNETWTSEQFNGHMVKERTGKRPLLTGELNVTMRDGIAPIGDIEFTDNSSWIRSRTFRVAVRVAPGSTQSVRIREGMTEAFVVKDHRGQLYKKHHPPVLRDEVWRLEKIGRDGAFHRKLSKEGIYTVQDFLKLSVVDPPKLRMVLGIGMSEKMMDVTINHARTCIIGNKLYVYRGSHFTIVLNPICQLVKAVINGQIISLRDARSMNRDYRSYLEVLVREAYLRWNTLEEIDGPLNDNITLLTHGETVKQFPNPSNHPLPIVAYEQNEYHGDKSMEASGSGASTVTSQVGSNESAMDPTYSTTSCGSGITYSISESTSDGDITPSPSWNLWA